MTDDTKSPTPAVPEAAVEAGARALAAYGQTFSTVGDAHARIDSTWRRFSSEAQAVLAAALPYLATPAPADNGAGMRIKPLVWTKYPGRSTLFAHTGVGMFFSLKPDQGVWHLIRHEQSSETHTVGENPDELKAFAQKRWEELVRSALVPATSVAEPSETTERTLAERMKKGASDFAAILNVDQGYIEGVKAAAKKVAKRRDGYVEEHGSYDPDTGATEFPGTGEEYVGELDEIEEEILALLSTPAAKNG